LFNATIQICFASASLLSLLAFPGTKGRNNPQNQLKIHQSSNVITNTVSKTLTYYRDVWPKLTAADLFTLRGQPSFVMMVSFDGKISGTTGRYIRYLAIN
jgi:hypothetical protein